MINILYNCKDFVVCEKPSGLVSEHIENSSNSLPALLSSQLGIDEIYVVHRLDKEVGGVIVFAKTKQMAAELSRQITYNIFEKEYWAELDGRISESHARLTDLLFHDRQKNKTYVVKKKRAGVKEAILDFELLAYNEVLNTSRIKIQLLTGRTHQIRVQFGSRGFPVCGDRKYGSVKNIKPIHLHSHTLRFLDKNGEPISFISEPDW